MIMTTIMITGIPTIMNMLMPIRMTTVTGMTIRRIRTMRICPPAAPFRLKRTFWRATMP